MKKMKILLPGIALFLTVGICLANASKSETKKKAKPALLTVYFSSPTGVGSLTSSFDCFYTSGVTMARIVTNNGTQIPLYQHDDLTGAVFFNP